ncbi:MAG TPA: gliding motility-associated C-terminal domain-containing protein [Saprospiraceae bacterium]|nr:gliding motility-associated C-terminal domain-containing protein [Saprospiraceae bacterium]
MKTLNQYWLIASMLTFLIQNTYSQTTLYPGDLAVIGLNVSNGDCGGDPGEDLISFVSLKAIQTGTIIDLTDNGWERLQPGTFGNSEGILRIERSGANLPAGSVVTLQTAGTNGNYQITSPDSDWIITPLHAVGNALNLSGGGDQLIFMQGGSWSNGSATGFGGFSQDASYTGGRFLYAFNTSDSWNAFRDSSQESGLPPGLQTCFNQNTTNGVTDFSAYAGPLEAASAIEWMDRLSDPQNWRNFPSCADYPSPSERIAVLENTVGLDCRECGSCEAYEETIYFRLPDTGGPFEVMYTQTEDTLLATNVVNGDSLNMSISTNSRLDIISVTDADGCTFIPNSNNGFEAQIEPLSYLYRANGSACQTACYTIDFSFEGNGPFLLRYYFSHQDSSAARNLIALTNERSLDICPEDFPEDQGPIDLVLVSLKDLNCTLLLDERMEVSNGGTKTFNLTEEICEDEFRLVNGTLYDINNPTGREIIPGGTVRGCDSIINVALTFQAPLQASLSGDAAICAGESTKLTINLNTVGTSTLEIQDDQAGLLYLTDVTDGTQVEVSPEQTTTYTLMEAESGCTSQADQSVTVAVSDLELAINPEMDYNGFGLPCADASDGSLALRITGGTAPFRVNWSTGDTETEIRELTAGTYQVSVTDDAGCNQTLSYTLTAPPPLEIRLGQDSSGCGGSSSALLIEQISGGVGPYEYSTDGQFFTPIGDLPFISPALEAGSYELFVQDLNDCQVQSNVSIGSGSNLLFDLGEDRSIVSGDSTVIEAFPAETPLATEWINTGDATFLNEFSIRVRPLRTQTYGLRLSYPDGCLLEDYVTIFVEQRKDYYSPNAFSPNKDGINERFTIFGGSQIRQISYLRVFSRWGELLFEQRGISPNAPFEGWDGTYRNQPADSGTYLFQAELEYRDGRRELISGTFVLLR